MDIIEKENKRIKELNDKQRLIQLERKVSDLEIIIDNILTAVEVDMGLPPVKTKI